MPVEMLFMVGVLLVILALIQEERVQRRIDINQAILSAWWDDCHAFGLDPFDMSIYNQLTVAQKRTNREMSAMLESGVF